MSRVLIIEDDKQLLRALAINLRARGYDVRTATDGHSAFAAASRHPPTWSSSTSDYPTWTA